MSGSKKKYQTKGPSGEVALIALAVEARERGMSYGKLVAGTSPEEQEKIVKRYKKRKAAGK